MSCRRVGVLLAVTALFGCNNDRVAGVDGSHYYISVLPSSDEVVKGQTLNLTGVLRTDNDATLPSTLLKWVSSNADIASVNQQGVVKGVREGVATITAAYEGARRSRVITVLTDSAVSISLFGQPASVNVGAYVALKADVIGVHNQIINVPQLTWWSENPEIATVSSSGLIHGMQMGLATIHVKSGGVSVTHVVRVRSTTPQSLHLTGISDTLLLGQSVQLRATVTATDGFPLDTHVTWSLEGNAVTLTQDGVVTGRNGGVSTVTAQVGGLTEKTDLAVFPFARYVTSIGFGWVEDLVVGESEWATAIGISATSGSGVIEPVDLRSSDPAILAVDSNNHVTAVGAGTVTLTASARRATSVTKTVRVYPQTTEAALPVVQSYSVARMANGSETWYIPTVVLKETSGRAGFRVTAVRAFLIGASGTYSEPLFTRISPGGTRTLWDTRYAYDDPFGIIVLPTAQPTGMALEIDYVDDAGNRRTINATAQVTQ